MRLSERAVAGLESARTRGRIGGRSKTVDGKMVSVTEAGSPRKTGARHVCRLRFVGELHIVKTTRNWALPLIIRA